MHHAIGIPSPRTLQRQRDVERRVGRDRAQPHPQLAHQPDAAAEQVGQHAGANLALAARLVLARKQCLPEQHEQPQNIFSRTIGTFGPGRWRSGRTTACAEATLPHISACMLLSGSPAESQQRASFRNQAVAGACAGAMCVLQEAPVPVQVPVQVHVGEMQASVQAAHQRQHV